MTVKIELGTLIHGTLRSEDLLQAFADELERINPDALSRVLKIYPEVRGKSATNIAEVDQTSIGEVLSEAIEMLMDALNEYAPAGVYFGAIEGDGADFGFGNDEDPDEDIATGKCNQRDSISCIKQTINGVYFHEQGCPNS